MPPFVNHVLTKAMNAHLFQNYVRQLSHNLMDFVIENVINTLKGKDTITANALEGMKVVDIIERIYEAK